MSMFLQWFSMHGYAAYVWSAYGLVLFVLLFNATQIKRHGLRIRRALSAWHDRF